MHRLIGPTAHSTQPTARQIGHSVHLTAMRPASCPWMTTRRIPPQWPHRRRNSIVAETHPARPAPTVFWAYGQYCLHRAMLH